MTPASEPGPGRSLLRVVYNELNRRGVLRIAGVYIVASWAAIQAADLMYEPLGFEKSPVGIVLVIALLGFPLAVGGAWFFNITRDSEPSATPLTQGQARVAMFGSLGFGTIVLLLGGWVALRGSGGVADRSSADPGALPPDHVAVLYFEQLSPDSSVNDYLATSLTHTLIGELSKVRGLEVISSNGVKEFKGGSASPDSIGRALNVGMLITGTVTTTRDSIIVAAELIESRSRRTLETISQRGSAGDPFQIVDSMVWKVSEALRTLVGTQIEVQRWKAGTKSAAAWELLQKSEQLETSSRAMQESGGTAAALANLRLADSLAAEAEALDDEYVDAMILRARLAYGRAFLLANPARPADSNVQRAAVAEGVGHASRALVRDPANTRALEIRGRLYAHELGVVSGAAAAMDTLTRLAEQDLRAAALDSTRASAMSQLSSLLQRRGDFAEARVYAEMAFNSDAYLQDSGAILARLFQTSFELGHDEDAEKWCAIAARRRAGTVTTAHCELLQLGWSTRRQPSIEAAWQTLDRIDRKRYPQIIAYMQPGLEMLVAGVIARAGDADSARAVLDRAVARKSPDTETLQLEAGVRLLLNEHEKARALLDRYFAMVDSPLLRQSRRFRALAAPTSRPTLP